MDANMVRSLGSRDRYTKFPRASMGCVIADVK
jgi:hypothetical protein